ncbi:MAG TPA: hypothetical protein DCR48_11295 [Flavobacteriales bacterium]|nr:hypothetical protein [Flavobacteriales bacterium]
MSLISLVIKSKSIPPPAEFIWQHVPNMPTFVKEIVTQSAGEDDEASADLSSVVSGMPTVFARSNMFSLAISNVTDKKMEGSALIHFYKNLIDEWRGLIACMALNHEKIDVKRIDLVYSDGEGKEATSNIYEPTGSFGNMLFERKLLWSDPNAIDPKPYIDVISYTKADGKKAVIGGTNPESLFFTSAAYNMAGEVAAFIKPDTGKFIDPLKRDIGPQDLLKVHSYVKHIVANIKGFADFFDKVDLISIASYGSLVGNLNTWLDEMDAYRSSKGIPNFENDEIPQISHFKPPYNKVFNYSSSIAARDGVIYDEGAPDGAVAFDPNELLLPKETTIACVDDDGDANFLVGKPLLMLKADVKGDPNDFRHFMLPLSPKGIRVFGKSLGTVLGSGETNIKSRLTGEYDIEEGKLHVTLSLFSQTKRVAEVPVIYNTTKEDISGKDLLLWPNFISDKWEKYFLYSEMPHNSTNWQAVPFCANLNSEDHDLIMDPSDPEKPLLIANSGKEADPESAKLHIELSSAVSSSKYEYEIYESKNPFKGFEMRYQNKLVGYAVIEYGTSSNATLQIDTSIGDLKPAYLGVDFGSTNSAIAYRVGDGEAQGFQFANRRVSLMAPGGDEKNNDVQPAGEDEVFFFQNDEIQSNAIKSILSLHDKKRMRDDKGQGNLTSLASEYVKGGFPCFEKNLPIEDSTDSTYLLNFGNASNSIGQATLIHSMKWSSDVASQEMDKANREAYLSSLLLQVYADLFKLGLWPQNLKWSYPSAMGENAVRNYNSIWREIGKANPLKEGHELTISVGEGQFDMDAGGSFASNTNGNDQPDEGGWGSSVTDAGGWGSGDSDSGGWGSSEPAQKAEQKSEGWAEDKPKIAKTKDIQLDDSAIAFDFQQIDDAKAMTESCAVANYLAESGNISTDPDVLTICFDIGGSTTDIMVLGQMMGPNGPGLAMVKQSSIRFAAQRVSQATRYSSNFKNVLVDHLNKKNVKVEGINKGANKFTENTAPYYFEQLVDRLEVDEFDDFYRDLGAKCKEMVAVNMYVTGLIVFYAGQIAKKLKMEIDRSPNKHPGWKNPKIQIQFTGKGSRIMDWLKAINPGADKRYYMDMFINGFGGMEAAKEHLGGPPVFQPRDAVSLAHEVKYEVAKGLASSTNKLYIPNTDQKPLEVIGEDGFELLNSSGESKKLTAEDSINSELMENIGGMFLHRPENPNKPCPRFMQFAHLYFQVATNYFGLKATEDDFMQGFRNMNISDFIRLMPEYKMAQRNSKGFDFVAPIIVLEGMRFFENVVLKKIAQK